MNYKTHNSRIFTDGTSLRGYVECSYDALVEYFGEPFVPFETKLDVAWDVEFEDGTVATIYNWKNGKRYLGEREGLALHEIKQWNVGGYDSKAVQLVRAIVME